MKTLKLLLILSIPNLLFAQISVPEQSYEKSDIPNAQNTQPEFQYASQGVVLNTIWENTFSNPADWVLGDYGPVGLTWQIGVGLETTGEAPIEFINSTTATDGVALIDSDAYGNSTGVENSWIETANSIDLTNFSNVNIEFENQYYMWDAGANDGSEFCLLEISTDGGTTWPDVETYEVSDAMPGSRFELWPNMSTQDPVNNPTTISFNISELAGGESNVKLRFRWVGTWGYAWYIDDVKLVEGFDNDLGLEGEAFADNSVYVGQNDIRFNAVVDNEGVLEPGLEYFQYPASQRPDIMATSSIINLGSNAATNAILSGTFNEVELSTTPVLLEAGDAISNVELGNWSTAGLPDGDYELLIEATSDEIDGNPSNNAASASIIMHPFEMARDNNQISGITPGQNDQGIGFSAGALYEVFGEGEVYSINVALTNNSVPGEQIAVQLLDATTENFDPIAESQEVEIVESQLNEIGGSEITWITVELDNPVMVEEGDLLLPVLTYYGGAGVHLATAQTDAPEQSCFLFGDFGVGGVDWYFTNDVPMVRLNFNPNGNCLEGQIMGCDDVSACNYSSLAECNDGSCEYSQEDCTLCGCSDFTACNYNPAVCYDNGSCCYGVCGCSNPLAENYVEEAECETECQFRVSGYVFNDLNQDGIFDSEENGLASHSVAIQPNGLSVYTDESGYYSVLVSGDEFSLSVVTTDAFPFPTSINPVEVNLAELGSINLDFGLTSLTPEYNIEVDLFPFGTTFLCNDYTWDHILFTNEGNVPLEGIVKYEYDELFQGHEEITPIDSVSGNILYMSFENLLPGQTLVYEVGLLTPTVEFIGEIITSRATIIGFYNDVEVANGEEEIELEVACAYDPNDKQAFPLGYTDEHWLLPETEQEFLIRFQNTGNAPAQNINIQDPIDDNFNLESFRFIGASHSVITTLDDESRMLDFFFEDIQLPDSVNNEPESHGFISFALTPNSDLPVGTELNNTAYIYFDNNEAIVTNTTWTTIHECGGEAEYEVDYPGFCVGEEVTLSATYPFVEDYTWYLDGEIISSESTATLTIEDEENHTISLVSMNPLCASSQENEYYISETPLAEITENGAVLTSSEGGDYQWLLNGEEIEGATEQTFLPTEDGNYSVVVVSDGGCSNTSEEVVIVNISEIDAATILLYPNPMTSSSILEFADSRKRTIRLMDSQGREVRVWNDIATQKLEIQKGGLAAGNYIIRIREKENEKTVNLIVE